MNNNLIAIAITAIAVTGCATPQAPSPLATEDLNVGIAKTCTPSNVDLPGTASATIAMTNDGWCALHAKQKDGKPFLLGLVKANPAHGRILIQKIGGETRIEYTANERYVGADKFTVALRQAEPNTPDATIQVAVNVTMGEGMAAVEAPKASTPGRTAATTRSTRPPVH